MNPWTIGSCVVLLAGVLVVATGTQHEKSLVGRNAVSIADLEGRPDSPAATCTLAQAYLDAHQPGLAIVLVESAPAAIRGDVRVRHVYARALLDEGRDGDALVVERSVVAECGGVRAAESPPPGCDNVLLASAQRRTSILEVLVKFGVQDALSNPDMSLVAYKNATREARIASE
jgi:hypothetical protein